jgi:hypothetical protein
MIVVLKVRIGLQERSVADKYEKEIEINRRRTENFIHRDKQGSKRNLDHSKARSPTGLKQKAKTSRKISKGLSRRRSYTHNPNLDYVTIGKKKEK